MHGWRPSSVMLTETGRSTHSAENITYLGARSVSPNTRLRPNHEQTPRRCTYGNPTAITLASYRITNPLQCSEPLLELDAAWMAQITVTHALGTSINNNNIT